MIQKITAAARGRNLLVLALVGSLAMGVATVAFAEDREEPFIDRRDELVDTDVDARDDDDLDDGDDVDAATAVTGATGATAATGVTGSSFDGGTLATGTATASPSASPAPLDTGDATRSNDGTVGGDTTAAPPPPPATADPATGYATNDGDSASVDDEASDDGNDGDSGDSGDDSDD